MTAEKAEPPEKKSKRKRLSKKIKFSIGFFLPFSSSHQAITP
jgi:hypothetical protein